MFSLKRRGTLLEVLRYVKISKLQNFQTPKIHKHSTTNKTSHFTHDQKLRAALVTARTLVLLLSVRLFVTRMSQELHAVRSVKSSTQYRNAYFGVFIRLFTLV
jgi:hypothetical protein